MLLYPLGFSISSCGCVGPSETGVERIVAQDTQTQVDASHIFFCVHTDFGVSVNAPTSGSGLFLYPGAKLQTCRGIIRCLGITKSCSVAFAQRLRPVVVMFLALMIDGLE